MLTPKQQRFVEEYLVDFKGGPAYTRAGYTATGNSAEAAASRLLRNAKVQAAIAAAQRALSERTEITQDMVLERWWQIATADPNDLIQYRRVCCRHCHGKGFEYQWLDEAEFKAAVVKFMEYKGDAPRDRPKKDGGYGYSKLAEVRADCPKCFGEGIEDIYAADTRKLKGASRLLYAGVKVTRDGLEIKMRDQDAAMANVARHLGMFKDKLELEVTDNLAEVLAAARERALGNRG